MLLSKLQKIIDPKNLNPVFGLSLLLMLYSKSRKKVCPLEMSFENYQFIYLLSMMLPLAVPPEIPRNLVFSSSSPRNLIAEPMFLSEFYLKLPLFAEIKACSAGICFSLDPGG